jgi:hypothetical protein
VRGPSADASAFHRNLKRLGGRLLELGDIHLEQTIMKMGLQMGLSTDATIAGNLFYSMRVQQMIKIWQNVFQQEQYRINLIVGSFLLIPVVFFSN